MIMNWKGKKRMERDGNKGGKRTGAKWRRIQRERLWWDTKDWKWLSQVMVH
jgi:hypothetical protein